MRILSSARYVFGLMLLATTFAFAQEPSGEADFPQNPAQWINSAPVSREALKGKAAFLWFYEEGCPRCRAKWPELIALSKQLEGEPIMFIAVNSGNARPSVEQYVRGVNLPWPVIVDPARTFEKAAGVNEISLMNIHSIRLLTPEGRLVDGDWSNVGETAKKALEGAKWNVDPADIPTPLRPAWTSIEFGNPAGGAALVKKGLNANKPEIKEAATKLNEYVVGKLQEDLEAAEKLAEADTWSKYKAYQKIDETYKGYDIPESVADTMKQLASDEDVKKQLAAMKQLATAKKSLTSTSPNARKTLTSRLKKIISDSPGTDAAEEAQAMLSQLPQ